MDTNEEKEKLIDSYKKALSLKPCKYFKQGRGVCPFAGNCFYLHANPDGRKVELPPPRPRRRRTGDGDLELLQRIVLWDIIDTAEQESPWLLHFDLEDMLDFFDETDSDSDWSDYEFLLD
jgi:E3 ubiquitin-protein ligase makorin